MIEGSHWESRYQLTTPPELTAEIASRRWRELNLLLHSLILLPTERGKETFFPVLRCAASIVGARRGLFHLEARRGTPLGLASSIGFGERLPEGLRLENRIARAVLRSGKPLLLNDPAEEKLRMEIRLLGERHCLAMPIMKRGRPWGAIQLVRATPFEEEEAVLLWIYALTVEGMLPALVESAPRPDEPRATGPEAGTVDQGRLRAALDWEIERSSWLQRPCSLVRIAWRNPESEVAEDAPSLLSGQSLRAIRQSLRPADLIASGGRNDLLICLPEVGSAEARKVMQHLSRNLLQWRTLGEESMVRRFLAMASASYPEDGERGADLIRAVEEPRVEAAGSLSQPESPTFEP